MADISKTPLEAELEIPVYMVSYADGPAAFRQNQKFLVYSALNKGVSHFFNYNRKLLDPAFAEKHKDVLALKKGAGYWLWKPRIILDTLNQIPENSYMIYVDSGFVFLKNPKPLFDLLQKHDVVLAAYENRAFSQAGCTKKEALEKTGCTTEICRNAHAMYAGVILIKNTPVARNFVQKWLALCEDKTWG
ncbi:MAG: hypothetical protein WCG05_05715 [Alphaproteobacteria bacterium]